MKSSFGKNLKISIWGGSHEPAIGVDIEGLPIGTEIDMKRLRDFLARRAPGSTPFGTKRKEPDIPEPVSGLKAKDADDAALKGALPKEEVPDGADRNGEAPEIMLVSEDRISLEIRNTDTRSGDYKALRTVPRPGHADYTARLRYGDDLNMAGGGPFSARMTAPLCIAGGIALQMLEKQGITTGAHIYSIGDVSDIPLDPVNIPVGTLNRLTTMDFPVLDEAAGEKMKEVIMGARNQLDSVGGIIEGCVVGLPGGIGGAMYDGLESALAPIFFGIPAVKGVEFGAGFSAAAMRGSEHNDPFYYDGDTVKTVTNNHGGILGGITTGMPLTVRLAFKPTSSISRKQKSVDLEKKENTELVVKGRHDPCVVVRAVPIVEAALALGILDCIMEVNND